MVSSLLHEAASKLPYTSETLRSAAKQSEGIHVIPVALRRAIKSYLKERESVHMNRKVLLLSESFSKMKDVNLQLADSSSRELVEDPLGQRSGGRWKIRSAYGDIGLTYREDETVAYVASRMPAVYSACYRVLKEIGRRLPGFSPSRVLDFGAGPGSALWAMREVWPRSLKHVNLVEPSKEMQRAAQSLLKDMKELPLIHSYDSIQALNRAVDKGNREHDLVISSYALGEIPSLSDRITLLRQLWDLTQDVLVLLEPGTPHGSKIIQQMRSYVLWMEKRRCRKNKNESGEVSSREKSITVRTTSLENGAFVVAPCSHDGRCPLEDSGKYCHFVQRLERTSSQRAYKRSKGQPLRGFEDEKFCFVALRRGRRPQEAWPLDDMEFETLKEQRAKRKLEDLTVGFEDQYETENEAEVNEQRTEVDEETQSEDDIVSYASDVAESTTFNEHEEEEEEQSHADLGGGWGRIIYMPMRRGKQVQMNVCRSTKRDGSEGTFERVVVTKSKNPTLHHQARRSLWGDLWPY